MTYSTQVRATFIDTKKAQNELRKELDKLESANSFVKNKEEFFYLIADALLGMDYDKQCIITLQDGSVLNINNLGKFIRHLGYCNNEVIDNKFFKDYNIVIKDSINIGWIWGRVKYELFGVFPEALAMSMRISKEQKKSTGGMGSYVGPKNIENFTG
jgi:hypothetical protein